MQLEGNRPNLGFWTSTEGSASWPLTIDHPGDFTVTLEYPAPESPGSEYMVTLGDRSLSGTLAATKGWHDYKTVKAGTISAVKGRCVLSIKPAKKPTVGLMNLRSVTLSPSASEVSGPGSEPVYFFARRAQSVRNLQEPGQGKLEAGQKWRV